MSVLSVTAVVFVSLAIWAAVVDQMTHRIPNRLILIGLIAGLLINATAQLMCDDLPFFSFQPWGTGSGRLGAVCQFLMPIGIVSWMAGVVLSFSIMLPVYLGAGCGAGDVKLAAVFGGLIGLYSNLSLLVVGHLLAALYVTALGIKRFGCLYPVGLICQAMLCFPGFDRLGRFAQFVKKFAAVHCPVEFFEFKIPMALFFGLGGLSVLLFPTAFS